MRIILIGNIVCTIGSLLMIGIGLIKDNRKILKAQCVMHVFLGTGNLILGGVSGFIANAISIIRNFFCLKDKYTNVTKIIFIGLQVLLTFFTSYTFWVSYLPLDIQNSKIITTLVSMSNNLGILTWLPIIAVCIYTWGLDTKSPIRLKSLIILAQIMWLIYDIPIKNYSTAVFDFATLVTNAVGIVLVLKGKKDAETSGEDI